MRDPYSNIFIRYGDPKEVEEVVTDAFLTTLDKLGSEYQEKVASLLSPTKPATSSFYQEITASELESDLNEKEIYLVGLSNQTKQDPPNLAETPEPSLDQDLLSRFDIVIDIGRDRLVAVEVKTQSSGFKKLNKYTELLGIDSKDQIDFITWHSVVEQLQSFDRKSELEEVFIDDLIELLQYNSPSKRFETVVYNEETGGANIFEIDRGPDMNEKTAYSAERPRFALRIDTTGKYIEDIYISPGEWEKLIDSLDEDAINAFLEADFSYFEGFEGDGRVVHGQAGEHPEPRKVIQTTTSSDSDTFVLGFRRRGQDATFQGGQAGYPMMGKEEFETFFGERLSKAERKRLFEEKDLTIFLKDL